MSVELLFLWDLLPTNSTAFNLINCGYMNNQVEAESYETCPHNFFFFFLVRHVLII